MLDIKRIRTDFDAVAEKLATRGVDAAVLNEMKEIDAKRRDILVKVETLKAERNTVSAEIAQAKRNKENADDKITAMQTLYQLYFPDKIKVFYLKHIHLLYIYLLQ